MEYGGAGRTRRTSIQAVGFDDRENNGRLAVNRFRAIEDKGRRPDTVLFVSGIPVGTIWLKNPNYPEVVREAWQLLRTYGDDLPTLFSASELLIVSGGMHARGDTLP